MAFSAFSKTTAWLIGISIAFIWFDIQYFVLVHFPGTRNEMCVMGANLTLLNLFFALVISAMLGFLMVGFIQLFQQKIQQHKIIGTSVSSTAGLFLGILSSFCTLCTLPILSLSGLSFILELLTEYQGTIKILSILLLGMSLVLLRRQLKQQCNRCVLA